jgi:protein-tyrosine-phosphatase
MNILFVCKANVGRSQMAESLFGMLSKHNVMSAGTDVKKGDEGKGLHDYVIGCLSEMRSDTSGSYRKQLTREIADWADRIYVMTDWKDVPDYLDYSKIKFWKVEDPKGKSYREHLETMREIKGLVEKLVREIG